MEKLLVSETNHSPCQTDDREWTVDRRDFLARSGLMIAGLAAGACTHRNIAPAGKPVLSFGIVTDAHYADTNARGIRYYRESIGKMNECVRLMNARRADFLIELGDLKDQTEPASEEQALADLSAIEAVFAQFNGPRYHVLGNHDMDCISKSQFLTRIENTGIIAGASYYSFDCNGVHFVVLDANYSSDGSDYDHGQFHWTDSNIPAKQLKWLKNDLASTGHPVVVFVHQQLDDNDGYSVRNAVRVRRVLERSRKVLAVFQGHHHEGYYSHIKGIHYYTLKAMVDGSGATNNSYAVVDLHADNSIVVTGYRKAVKTVCFK